jgi:hypothetical protein
LVKPAADPIPDHATAATVVSKTELVPVNEPMVNSQRMHLVPGARDSLNKASLTNGNGMTPIKETKKEKKQSKSPKPSSKSASAESVIHDSSAIFKKDKKRKRKEFAQVGEEQSNDASGFLEESQPKKAKKTKKRKHSDDAVEEVEEVVNSRAETAADEAPVEPIKKEKKQKKDKKTKKDKKVKTEAESDAYDTAQPSDAQGTKADEAAQWDVAGVSGGAKRQSKFLKLLGGEKHGISVAATNAKQRDRDDRAAVKEELERQFEEGMLAKEERQRGGKRLGLGA